MIYLLIIALGKALISAADWRSFGRFTRVRVYSAGVARAQRIFVTDRFRKELRKEWQLLQHFVGRSMRFVGCLRSQCATLAGAWQARQGEKRRANRT